MVCHLERVNKRLTDVLIEGISIIKNQQLNQLSMTVVIPNTTCHCAETQRSYPFITYLKQPLIINLSFINYWQSDSYKLSIFAFVSSKTSFCFADKTHSTVVSNRVTKAFPLLLHSQSTSANISVRSYLRTCSVAIWLQAFDSCFQGRITYLYNKPPGTQTRKSKPFLAQKQIFQQQFQKLLFSYMCNQYPCRCCCDYAAKLSCAQDCCLCGSVISLAVLWCMRVSPLLNMVCELPWTMEWNQPAATLKEMKFC